MRVVSLGERQHVDVCDGCGAAVLDFFDGEPSALATLLAEHATSFVEERGTLLAEVSLPANCPDCQVEMEMTLYLQQGPHIARCSHCLCAYLPATRVLQLAQFKEIETKEEGGWLGRLIRSIF